MALVAAIAAAARAGDGDVDLSPAAWGEGERAAQFLENERFGGPNAPARGRVAVTGTTGPPAIRAGLEALRQGGSAVDAVLTTALAQVVLAAGSWVSGAGILSLVVYDPETKEVWTLNAAFDTVRGEVDPLSIPSRTKAGGADSPTPSGRTALVPGFMAGVEAAHRRFGRLPFASLFGPAIDFAEHGFPLTALHAGMLESREGALRRLEETRAIFTREDGSFVGAGDLFRQPALARTLRSVAEQGAAYVYEGAWAERFVAAVRRDGGFVTLDDLKAYEARWAPPIRVPYRGFEVALPALPAHGGLAVAEGLRVAERLDVAGFGSITASAESFFWLHQASVLFALNHVDEKTASAMIGGLDASPEARLTDEHADRLTERIRSGRSWLARPPATRSSNHSDAIVAVDARGGVAALVHSINTTAWGDTAIFVDGVSIPDSACFQQELVARTGPGRRLPDATEPLIVLRDGVPVAALASIGGGLHQVTMSALLELLGRGAPIEAALAAPSTHLPAFLGLAGARARVFEGEFEPSLLEEVSELGLEVEVLAPREGGAARGYVVGASIDPESGRVTALGTSVLNGRAQADD